MWLEQQSHPRSICWSCFFLRLKMSWTQQEKESAFNSSESLLAFWFLFKQPGITARKAMGRSVDGLQGSGYQFAHFLKEFVYVTNCLQVSDLSGREEGSRGPSALAPQHPPSCYIHNGNTAWLVWRKNGRDGCTQDSRKYPHLERRIFCVTPFMIWKEPTARAPDDSGKCELCSGVKLTVWGTTPFISLESHNLVVAKAMWLWFSASRKTQKETHSLQEI